MKFTTCAAFFMFLFFNACVEETTSTSSFLKNSSGVPISIDIFQEGVVTKHFDIENNSILRVSENNNRGKGTGLSFPNIDIPLMDSAIVTFDSVRKSVHFSGINRFDSSRVIYFGNPRSLFTERNYIRSIRSESKHKIDNEYLFEFIVQDYLKAK